MRVEPPDLPRDDIERALDGDPAAFRRFYARYDPTVRWAVGVRVFRWPQLTAEFDDIVQEAWCELVRNEGKRLRYHDDTRNVPFWRFLAFIAMRLGWKLAKRRLRHGEVEEMVDVADPDERLAERLMDGDLLERLSTLAKARLDEKDWCLFEGHYVHGRRLKDIAAALKMTDDAVFQRHRRLLKKLRTMAEELLAADPGKLPPELVAVALAVFVAMSPDQRWPLDPTLGSMGSVEMLGLEVNHEQ